jgi:RND family efflux transporter MFP subunit
MPKLPPALVSALRIGVTLVVVAVGLYAGRRVWLHYQAEPWTRDGRVRADVVEIAPDVSGLVTNVAVAHDQTVKRGQLLFTIDRDRFELALRQADAAIVTAKAAIGVQKAAIVVHRAALGEALREAARNDSLGSLVSREQIDQSHTKVSEEEAAIAQGEAAVTQAEAALAQAETARAVAVLNLDRTEVHAPTDGMLSDVTIRVGDYVSPGKPVVALVDAGSIRVEGYFEETKIRHLRIGQSVEIRLMGEETPLHGHIQSISPAIEDRERGPSASMLPNVNPTFSWVRLAQRIPVRIALDKVPEDIRLIAGRTASVTALTKDGEPVK